MTDDPQVGDRIVTTSYGKVRGRARQYPYWQPAVYEVVRLADGRIVARYWGHVCGARRSPKLAKASALKYAADHELHYVPEVRQWTPIGPQPEPRRARPARAVQGELFDGD